MNISFQSLNDSEFPQLEFVNQTEVSKALKVFETWLNSYQSKEFALRVACREIMGNNPNLDRLTIAVAISQGLRFLSDLGIAEHRFLFKNKYYNNLSELPDMENENADDVETIIILNRNDNE